MSTGGAGGPQGIAIEQGMLLAQQAIQQEVNNLIGSRDLREGGPQSRIFDPSLTTSPANPLWVTELGQDIGARSAVRGAMATQPEAWTMGALGLAAEAGYASPETGATIEGAEAVVEKNAVAAENVLADPFSPGAWIELGKVVAALPTQFEKLGDSVTSVADRLAGFDANMAEASVIQQVGQIERDIESAQATGEGILELTQRVEEIKNELQPLKDLVTNVLVELLKRIADYVEFGLGAVKQGVALMGTIPELIGQTLGAMGFEKQAANIANYLARIARNTDKQGEGDQILAQSLRSLIEGSEDSATGGEGVSFEKNSAYGAMTESDRKAGRAPGIRDMEL